MNVPLLCSCTTFGVVVQVYFDVVADVLNLLNDDDDVVTYLIVVVVCRFGFIYIKSPIE